MGAGLNQRKEITDGFLGAGGGRGEAGRRRFRSPGSERLAVLGSRLEPLISQRRVTWMPGIPEPGLFRCACPPAAPSRSGPRPSRAAGGGTLGQRGQDVLRGGAFLSRRSPQLPPRLVLPSCLPLAPSSVSRLGSNPHPGFPTLPDWSKVLSQWLGVAKVSGLLAPAGALEVSAR